MAWEAFSQSWWISHSDAATEEISELPSWG